MISSGCEISEWQRAARSQAGNDFVMALSVSSIVEGIDQSTETHIVDLFDDSFETPDDAAKAYSAALQAVNLVATHG